MEEKEQIATVFLIMGIAGILVGVSIPSTSTYSSTTCVQGVTGVGEDCVTGSVTTGNPLKAPAIGAGILFLIGGLTTLAFNVAESTTAEDTSQNNVSGGFAEKIQKQQKDINSESTDDKRDK